VLQIPQKHEQTEYIGKEKIQIKQEEKMIGLILITLLSMSDKKAMDKINFFSGKLQEEMLLINTNKSILDNGYFNTMNTNIPFVASNRNTIKAIIDTSSNMGTIINLVSPSFKLLLVAGNKAYLKAKIDSSNLQIKQYADSVKKYLDSLVIN
jgi:hypothetical protein